MKEIVAFSPLEILEALADDPKVLTSPGFEYYMDEQSCKQTAATGRHNHICEYFCNMSFKYEF